MERELMPFDTIADHIPKYLLTMDNDPPVSHNGIRQAFCAGLAAWKVIVWNQEESFIIDEKSASLVLRFALLLDILIPEKWCEYGS